MKTVLRFARLSSLMLLFVITVVIGCKNDEPVPQGVLLFYTNYDATKYDKIEVIVNDKVMGQITQSIDTKPECNAPNSASVATVMLTVGSYSVGAKRYKAGALVGNWKTSTASVTTEDCKKLRLIE